MSAEFAVVKNSLCALFAIALPFLCYAVLGGKNSDMFDRFVDVCCRAYNVLRRNADLLITLFVLMLSTGIPELQKVCLNQAVRRILMHTICSRSLNSTRSSGSLSLDRKRRKCPAVLDDRSYLGFLCDDPSASHRCSLIFRPP